MSDLRSSWEKTRNLLQLALNELPPSARDATQLAPGVIVASVTQFQDFYDHNELELAWDILADLGVQHDLSAGFWRFLSEAAKSMKLIHKSDLALSRMKHCQ